MPYVLHGGSIQVAAVLAAAPQAIASQATASQGTGSPAPVAPPAPNIPQLPSVAGEAVTSGGASGAAQTIAGTLQPPFLPVSPIPHEVIPIVGITFSMLAAMVIGYPIARAIGRVIERRGGAGVVKAADVAPQLRQLQESVDAMSVELERIGEAQRFTAKLMSERAAALPASERPSA